MTDVAVAMGRLVRSESFKLRTVWSTWLLVGLAVVVVALLGVLVALAPHRGGAPTLIPPKGTARWFALVLSTMNVSQDLALVLGVLCVTGEYRHRTVTSTFLVTPRRGRVTASKFVTAGGAGLVVGAVAALTGLLLGFALVAGGNGDVHVMLDQYGRVAPGILAASVLFALYGVGLGAALRNQVLALVVGLGFSALVEPIVQAALPALGKWLPDYAAQALSPSTASAAGGFGVRHVALLAWWEGVLVLLGYGVVLAVLGTMTTLRADVT